MDRKKVFDSYKKAQDALRAMEKDRDVKQKELDVLSEAVQARKKEFEGKAGALSAEENQAISEEIQAMWKEYVRRFEQLQEDLNSQQQKVILKSRQEIDAVIMAIGAEENCHLVLEGDPNSTSGVLYYSPAIDITSRVVERVNAEKKE